MVMQFLFESGICFIRKRITALRTFRQQILNRFGVTLKATLK
jgi:hypothetical protein